MGGRVRGAGQKEGYIKKKSGSLSLNDIFSTSGAVRLVRKNKTKGTDVNKSYKKKQS